MLWEGYPCEDASWVEEQDLTTEIINYSMTLYVCHMAYPFRHTGLGAGHGRFTA